MNRTAGRHRRRSTWPILAVVLPAALVSAGCFRHPRRQARIAAARADLMNLNVALDMYRLDAGAYPSTEEGLEALIRPPVNENPAQRRWQGPYLSGSMPRDPWGSAYVYRSPGEARRASFDLLSFGPDGEEGTGDDIANRDKGRE